MVIIVKNVLTCLYLAIPASIHSILSYSKQNKTDNAFNTLEAKIRSGRSKSPQSTLQPITFISLLTLCYQHLITVNCRYRFQKRACIHSRFDVQHERTGAILPLLTCAHTSSRNILHIRLYLYFYEYTCSGFFIYVPLDHIINK